MGCIVDLTVHNKAASGRYIPFATPSEAVAKLIEMYQAAGVVMGEFLTTVSIHETNLEDTLQIIALCYDVADGYQLQLVTDTEVVDLTGDTDPTAIDES